MTPEVLARGRRAVRRPPGSGSTPPGGEAGLALDAACGGNNDPRAEA